MNGPPSAQANNGTDGASLFDALGGREAMNEIVQQFYERVLADPELGPMFKSVEMSRLVHMQQEFLTGALGGPDGYSGVQLRTAHAGRGITRHHFSRFVEHFLVTIEARDVPRPTIDQIAERLALYVDDVVGSYGESG